jgi:hypothetical protein
MRMSWAKNEKGEESLQNSSQRIRKTVTTWEIRRNFEDNIKIYGLDSNETGINPVFVSFKYDIDI